MTMALHSDQNNYKTNEYTLFSEAKKRGESVQSKEKGVLVGLVVVLVTVKCHCHGIEG